MLRQDEDAAGIEKDAVDRHGLDVRTSQRLPGAPYCEAFDLEFADAGFLAVNPKTGLMTLASSSAYAR